ncbi:hypothetical protein HKX48_001210 [Thoreauomyces humboldtii]|nr:hypothetical protein HKX48_001210 [Thoreauomyces humboldtii]
MQLSLLALAFGALCVSAAPVSNTDSAADWNPKWGHGPVVVDKPKVHHGVGPIDICKSICSVHPTAEVCVGRVCPEINKRTADWNPKWGHGPVVEKPKIHKGLGPVDICKSICSVNPTAEVCVGRVCPDITKRAADWNPKAGHGPVVEKPKIHKGVGPVDICKSICSVNPTAEVCIGRVCKA